ncbi:hypothetical protein TPHA_0C01480 [Tetrapisispora phaffii CBS 4417]|uniref:Uncharacterized protein n=1 Tax=Tetrapisispora phaffii (strain ATCC 24235 / CBS 4417 / NBRC 1672 / NRRL Y-8282 / UCD 70-5) TaxID=1071381 RepID=G8BRC8_TETPH|nr:hypothetical protein TPHA_0C01480 [Tetrapisispora phaffii CBS 4417]CCE62304.1 hypothetical protein TPHA_0C01480 [Tetrapisispora phaffii CBS 4417]
MESNNPEQLNPEIENAPEEEFIANNEVDQEVVVDDEAHMEEDDENDEEQLDTEENRNREDETIEIDMSNNSISYFDKHTDSIFTVFHHPTLPLVVSGGGDNVANLWTSHSHPPKFAGALTDHTESVISGGFTSDGKYLVTGDMNGKILIHASTKGGAQWKLTSVLQEVEEIIWLKCHTVIPGIFAFGATNGSVWVYQINEVDGSVEPIMSGFVHTEECTMGEFINIDQGENVLELVTCSVNGTVVGWNCYTGQQTFKISQSDTKGVVAPWVSIASAPTNKKNTTPIVAVGSNNGVLAIINCANGSVLHLSTVIELKEDQEELDASIESISWSTDFPLLAIGLVCGDILLYDINTWRVRRKFTLEDSVTRLTFDKTDLFVSCVNGKVYQYDARTGSEKFVCCGHNMGVLDFVLLQGKDNNLRRIITAGDEGVSLIFEVPN